MKKYTVGVVGATGMVGQRFVTLLENHPWFQLESLMKRLSVPAGP